jgi:hypothetical protein
VPRPELEGQVPELIAEAEARFQAAQDCLKAGDWACYGLEMDLLEETLEALVAATQE